VRHGKCLLAVWLASTMLAGCGDSKMVKARKELGRRVDEARRLHSHAVALLANPAYVDTVTGQGFPSAEKVLLKPDSPLAGRIGGSVVGKVTRVGATYRVETRTGKVYTIPAAQVRSIEAYPVPDAEIKVPTQPIEPQRSIKLLERARKLLEEALADWPEAPVGSRADVAQLLGDVEYARGRFIADAAQRLRRQAEDMHVRARTLLRTARNRAVVVSFNRKLAAMPREKLLALREQTQKTLAAKNAEVKALDAKIVRLQNEIQALAAKNKALTRRIRQLRARSELATGRKRLELAKQAHVLERQENANTGQIEAKRDSIANLTVDRAFARRAAQAAQARLQVLEQSLSDMAKVKQDSDRAGREAGAGVERTMRKVGALAAKVVEHCRSVLEREGAALEAMAAAAKHYGAACEYLRAESQAAVEAIKLPRPRGWPFRRWWPSSGPSRPRTPRRGSWRRRITKRPRTACWLCSGLTWTTGRSGGVPARELAGTSVGFTRVSWPTPIWGTTALRATRRCWRRPRSSWTRRWKAGSCRHTSRRSGG